MIYNTININRFLWIFNFVLILIYPVVNPGIGVKGMPKHNKCLGIPLPYLFYNKVIY